MAAPILWAPSLFFGLFLQEKTLHAQPVCVLMGWNGSKSGFLGAKVGQNWVETHFSPTFNPFPDFRKNPLFTQFKGVEIVF